MMLFSWHGSCYRSRREQIQAKTIMSVNHNLAAVLTLHPLRWRYALWRAILPDIFSFEVGSHGVTGAHPESSSDAQLTGAVPSTNLNSEAPSASNDKSFYWDTLAAQISVVILWDESGSVRRTGPGQSNTQTSGIAIMVSGR